MKQVIAATTLILLSGCSFLVPWNQDLTVRADPEDAKIHLNGEEKGEGTVTESVPRNDSVSVLVTHPDYANQNRDIDTTMSGTGTADLVGGAILAFPALGLVAPGAWKLQKDNMTVVLEEKD